MSVIEKMAHAFAAYVHGEAEAQRFDTPMLGFADAQPNLHPLTRPAATASPD